MASKFKVSESPDCEDLAIRWQSHQVDLLNSALRSAGVTDQQTRREILEEFFFSMATMFDGSSSGVEFEERDYRPRLVFEDPTKPGEILVSDAYDLHDYTHSDIAAVLAEESE